MGALYKARSFMRSIAMRALGCLGIIPFSEESFELSELLPQPLTVIVGTSEGPPWMAILPLVSGVH